MSISNYYSLFTKVLYVVDGFRQHHVERLWDEEHRSDGRDHAENAEHQVR